MADAIGSEIKSSGITAKTPGNILLGAGTIHKGFKFDASTKKWNFTESLIGATSGGNKLEITPSVQTIEVDGALVKVKGLDVKQGETVKLEINLIELTPEIIKAAVIGQAGNSELDFSPFINVFMEGRESEMQWEYFLAKIFDKSFNEFVEDMKGSQEMTESDLEATIQDSMSMAIDFIPE